MASLKLQCFAEADAKRSKGVALNPFPIKTSRFKGAENQQPLKAPSHGHESFVTGNHVQSFSQDTDKKLNEKFSGEVAVYSRAKSVIVVNNGKLSTNRFLPEFRDNRSRSKDVQSSGCDSEDSRCPPPRTSVHNNSLYPRLPQEQDHPPIKAPDGPPPLEGDPDDPAMLNQQPHADSEQVHKSYGQGDAVTHREDADLNGKPTLSCDTVESENFQDGDMRDAVRFMDKSSLALLDTFLVACLPSCQVTVDHGRVLVSPPSSSAVYTSLLDEAISRTDETISEHIRNLRHILTLVTALFKRKLSYSMDDAESGNAFLGWISSVLPDVPGQLESPDDKDYSQSEWHDVHHHVLELLTRGNWHQAAVFAVSEGDPELGHLIASVAAPPVSPKVDIELQNMLAACLSDDSAVFAAKILLLLTGIMSTSSVSACDGLSWLTCLGMYALFAVDPAVEPNVSAIVQIYEEAEQSDFGWTGPTTSPDSTFPSAFFFDIIRYFLGRTTLEALLDTLNSSSFDLCFKWLFLNLLSCFDIPVDRMQMELGAKELAKSLEAAHKWEHAVIVWLHSQPSAARDDHIRNLIISGIGDSDIGFDCNLTEKRLVDILHLPTEWIREGRAAQAIRHHQYGTAALTYIDLKLYGRAGRVILENILPDVERSGSDDIYRALFVANDRLMEVLEDPDLDHYRQFVPVVHLLKTFKQSQEHGHMSVACMAKLESDLLDAKRVLANHEVTPVMRKLVERVESHLKNTEEAVARSEVFLTPSFLNRLRGILHL